MANAERGRAADAASGVSSSRDEGVGATFNASVLLEPGAMRDAWRVDTGRLLVHLPAAPRRGQRVALRVQLTGGRAAATVLCKAIGAHRHLAGFQVELAPEAEGAPALRMLLAAASGEPVRFVERQLRWLARLPVMVASGGGMTYMHTFSVAESGCGLSWSGPRPAVGQPVLLRFGVSRGVEVAGVIRWVSGGGGSVTAGVEIGSEVRGVWRSVLGEVARGGAPQA